MVGLREVIKVGFFKGSSIIKEGEYGPWNDHIRQYSLN